MYNYIYIIRGFTKSRSFLVRGTGTVTITSEDCEYFGRVN